MAPYHDFAFIESVEVKHPSRVRGTVRLEKGPKPSILDLFDACGVITYQEVLFKFRKEAHAKSPWWSCPLLSSCEFHE